MIYLLSGTERILINKEIDRIISNKDAEVVNIDCTAKDFDIKALMFEIDNISLFSSRKVIICHEPSFLIGKSDDKNLDKLLDYCRNPYYEQDLIFTSNKGSFNDKLKAYKEIRMNAREMVFSQLKPREFYSRALSELGSYKLDFTSSGRDLFINCCNGSFDTFYNGMEILGLYPGRIDERVIEALFISENDPKIFELADAIYNKNLTKAFKIKKDMLKSTSIQGLIAALASELRFLYYVNYLLQKGYSENEIISDTKAHSYRISNAIKNSKKMKQMKIISLLNDLAKLDYQLKSDSTMQGELVLDYYLLHAMKEKQ